MIVMHDPFGTLCTYYSESQLRVLERSLVLNRAITMSTSVWFVPGTITDVGTVNDAHSRAA